jgi:hypothetical protein
MSSGTVHVYITAPDGHTIDSMHVAQASKVEELTAMLERDIAKLKTLEGKPLAPPTCQSTGPKAEADSLVLHLTARTLVRQGDEYVPRTPVLGENRSGSWGAYAAENWVVLNRDEWTKLLPGGKLAPGTAWDMDKATAAKVLTYFYPSTENNDVRTNRIDQQTLRATVLSVQDGVARARIEGSLRMKHPFYHKDDDNFVDATLVGIVDFEPDKPKIRALQLVTDRATYGRTTFGVGVHSVP